MEGMVNNILLAFVIIVPNVGLKIHLYISIVKTYEYYVLEGEGSKRK